MSPARKGKDRCPGTPCTQRGKDAIVATFSAKRRPLPGAQPVHHQRRKPQAATAGAAQAAARAAEKTTGFQADYGSLRRWRFEGTMHQATAPAVLPPRPTENPPRPRVHGLRAQSPPAARLLDRHPTGPAPDTHLVSSTWASPHNRRIPPGSVSAVAFDVQRRGLRSRGQGHERAMGPVRGGASASERSRSSFGRTWCIPE